ncbi:hypothetical protein ACFWIZ_41225, partial [Streptomyces sp. NPDC127044]
MRPATEQAGPVEEPPGSTPGSPGVQALTVVTVPFGFVARVVGEGPHNPQPTPNTAAPDGPGPAGAAA